MAERAGTKLGPDRLIYTEGKGWELMSGKYVNEVIRSEPALAESLYEINSIWMNYG